MTPLLAFKVSLRIHTEEDKEQQRESPEGGTSVGEERERNANDRCQSQHHAHVDEQVEKEYAQHAIAIDSSHRVGLSFCHSNESPDEEQIDDEHASRTDKPFFFTYRAEDEVGVLLGHISELGLRAVEESLPQQTS